MAFSVPIWEVQTTGDDTNNGGGFCTGGSVVFPTDGAATSATGASPVFSSASYNFVAGDVGYWIFIKSGTNWTPGWYKITAVAANAATLDATIGHAILYSASATPGQSLGLSRVTGCATTASPSSATWGIDYSQGSPIITFDDMVVGSTTTQFTSVHNPVAKNFIGNVISVTSGATVQRVCVISTSGTTATCDKSLGTAAQVGVGKMGGPLASIGLAGSLAISTNAIWVKSGSYSITSASTNVAAGCLSVTVATRLEGYGTYRGDLGTAPVLTASGINTATLASLATVATHFVRNLTFDGASLTAIRGLSVTSFHIERVTVQNCTNTGFYIASSNCQLFSCRATGCATAGSAFGGLPGAATSFFGCVADNNTVTGFVAGAVSIFERCISTTNTGSTSDGFQHSTGDIVTNCIAYGNGRDGFRIGTALNNVLFINCIAEGNGVSAAGYGFNGANAAPLAGTVILYCATYNNTTGAINFTNLPMVAENNITGSASFFVNAAGGNFAPALTANTRSVGFPGAMLSGGTGYLDMGALQAQNLGSGGSSGFLNVSSINVFGVH